MYLRECLSEGWVVLSSLLERNRRDREPGGVLLSENISDANAYVNFTFLNGRETASPAIGLLKVDNTIRRAAHLKIRDWLR